MPFSFHLPSRLMYSLMVIGELLEMSCRIFLVYAFLIIVLLLPFSMQLFQWGSTYIEDVPVNQSTRVQYGRDALAIILTGKVYSTTYNADEIAHLSDVRRLAFTLFILTIVVVLLFFYLRINKQHFDLLSRTRLYTLAAGAIAVITLLMAALFPFFFAVFHSLFFRQGNYVFATDSPLIQAFPLSFWFLAFLFLQVGVLISLIIQALHARSQEI